jgi:ribosome-associated protein
MNFTEEQKQQLVSEITFTASRSSGPGGQNVNKVNSRVELRFSVKDSDFFTGDEKKRLFLKLKNKINSNGELILSSQSARSQLENKELALVKFYSIIEKALTIQKKRMKTKPTIASKIKRLESKKLQSLKKYYRKSPEN